VIIRDECAHTQVEAMETVIIGSISGCLAIAVCHPIDVVRTKMQVQASTFGACVRDTADKEGLRGFYKGFSGPFIAQGVYKSVLFSVNVGADGESAVFFGLSGTGKKTLSDDPQRPLLGDDEHGWSNSTVFNFEGGCYAKMIKLSAEAEPEIFATTKRFGTVLENVVVDPVTRQLDLDDNSLTENTRGAYPLSFIPNSLSSGIAGVPTNIIMLTADAFGVMPPIAKLTPSQAMYHFLSGYTAKVAGTEKGLGNEPQATFSTCFGAPFMPRHPSVYGNLLRQKIAAGNVSCWLVNTGWTGGAFGTGKRMPIKVTRALVTAAIDGSLQSSDMRTDENFGFEVPTSVHGVPDELLNPRTTWADGSAYDAQAQKLVNMFVSNFKTYENYVSQDVLDASPRIAK
jgi:phosphoenolpyruvate carboxykinase (ATP)